MRHAVNLPPFAPPETLVSLAVDAERAGWDGVFFWDHMTWLPELRLDVHDPWVLLGAVAVRTERVVLGTMVTPLARRRPWKVAKELTTLDHLSGGRTVLGVGLGAPPDAEFAAFGEPSDARHRANVLDEGLAVLDGLLRGRVDHDGEHFEVHTELLPRPVQSPRPPIWVAGESPHRRPLRRALGWDGFVPLSVGGALTPEQVADYLDGVERPPGWDVVSVHMAGHPARDYEKAGVTWLVTGIDPEGGWVDELRASIRRGPRD
ncbi:MAG TPA: LLM class flavin-dependent oxidoreductase [Pseudonocardia sp.]|jgi:alkanesulfonate monooxygenase SsuD/methylene tetrahydromethanopterin reductase-like flavin-dependent oxidoreductase (luciferase family)|uniref:LLM class flavin-dependent oxidoreductase n=1 Tax=Pseudonocardia sp. TaxID=60912 RepID=UPI002B4B4CF0|nr:LLM class flavin-dependent oxidoreductase [Pseudonocardia sp.]HLU55796.1 LLM class flavin-dependent oxidoreductase [Pseudonocardia sp.]